MTLNDAPSEQDTPPHEFERWLTITMATERGHVSRSTINRLIKRGSLPVYYLGDKPLIDREEFDALISGSKEPFTSDLDLAA